MFFFIKSYVSKANRKKIDDTEKGVEFLTYYIC